MEIAENRFIIGNHWIIHDHPFIILYCSEYRCYVNYHSKFTYLISLTVQILLNLEAIQVRS